MSDNPGIPLTFGQRMGVEPLPAQMNPQEVSQALKSLLWSITKESIEGSTNSGSGYYVVTEPWRSLLRDFFVLHHHGDVDNLSIDVNWSKNFAKSYVYSDEYLKVFKFLDFVIGSRNCPLKYYKAIQFALEATHSAYRVVERMIVPVTSDENAQAITEALSTVGAIAAKGPSTHLQQAAKCLTAGDWAGAIRESIHSVESAAKLITSDADTLGPALAKLEARGLINVAQKKAFGALYGYTSDTKGVRHALALEDKAAVSEQDAIFMFGACAAFASYLVAGQLSD